MVDIEHTVKEAEGTEEEKTPYWLPDRVYQALKWIGLLALPTLAWAYQALSQAWGWPYTTEVPFTLNILGTMVAVLIGASSLPALTKKGE